MSKNDLVEKQITAKVGDNNANIVIGEDIALYLSKKYEHTDPVDLFIGLVMNGILNKSVFIYEDNRRTIRAWLFDACTRINEESSLPDRKFVLGYTDENSPLAVITSATLSTSLSG